MGPFELLAELGRGGQGTVRRARDAGGQEVALKLLPALTDHADRERFAREVEALRRVEDPGLVRVLGADLQGPRPWIALELVEGESLEARLRERGPLDPAQAVRVVGALAETLGRLHGLGIVHRDLKPANVLLRPDGSPVLLDLGLALLADAGGLTRTGELLGTPTYMAPEQAQGLPGSTGPATDVWGLGAVLYALLSGQPPFPGEQPLEVLTAVLTSQPAPPSRHRPGLDPRLERLVLRCLTKDPAERPQLPELQRALRALREPVQPAAARGGGTLLAVSAGMVAALGGLVVWWVAAAPAADPRPAPPPSPAPDPARLAREQLELGHARSLRDPRAAIEAYSRALELDPTLAQAWSARGGDRCRVGDLDGAAADLDRALALDPGWAGAWCNLGVLRRARRDLDGAEQAFRRSRELDPQLPEAAAGLAAVCLDRGDLAGALQGYEQALTLGPGQALLWANRAVVHEELGQPELALAAYDQALELDPGLTPARLDRAGLRAKRRDWSGALSDYDRVLAERPADVRALLHRAQVRMLLDDPGGARADLDRAIELEPERPEPWLQRGRLFGRLREWEPARRDLERASQLATPGSRVEDEVRSLLEQVRANLPPPR